METRREFHLEPQRIYAAVKTALALQQKPALEAVDLDGAPGGTVFRMAPLTGSWARCLEGLPHPHTGRIRPITFDHAIAKGRDDVVLVHLNHILVQMSLRLLRAEVWAQSDVKKLHRVDIRSVPRGDFDGIALVVLSRLVITGGKHHRLHEELTLSGGYLRDNSFVRENRVTQVDNWLESSKSFRAGTRLFEGIARWFGKQQEAILAAADARSRDRLRSLENTLDLRKRQEVDNITTVLDELTASISAELRKEEEPEQLRLFSEDERLQIRRDIEALRTRLARIPEEKAEEIGAIEARFTAYDVRTFPVAVIALVPEGHPWRVGA